jgi:hypothetical protein
MQLDARLSLVVAAFGRATVATMMPVSVAPSHVTLLSCHIEPGWLADLKNFIGSQKDEALKSHTARRPRAPSVSL